tara:strand:+ start:1160 stop:1372 length:213 start_codon:yes stop_codon:yes gene_type:complete
LFIYLRNIENKIFRAVDRKKVALLVYFGSLLCACRFSYLLWVVESNPVIDDPFCLEAIGDFMPVSGLLFQ